MKKLDEYVYKIQNPFLSFIEIDDNLKEDIIKQSWSVWEFFSQITQFEYYPVLTIFTREYIVRYLKYLVEEFDRIYLEKRSTIKSEELKRYLSEILRFLIYEDIIEENFDQDLKTCQEWKELLFIFLLRLEELKIDDFRPVFYCEI